MNETRKLFGIGGSLGVTIPQRWIEHNQLSNGDNVEIEVHMDKIIILKPKGN